MNGQAGMSIKDFADFADSSAFVRVRPRPIT